jgi:hypothetical protein
MQRFSVDDLERAMRDTTVIFSLLIASLTNVVCLYACL